MGASKPIHRRAFDFEFREFSSRCELNRVSFDKCNQFSKLRTWGWERPCSLLGFHHEYTTHAAREKKSQKTLLYLTGLVFAMVGCTYAAVPLYRRFCQATGYGGTVQRREVKIGSLKYSSWVFLFGSC